MKSVYILSYTILILALSASLAGLLAGDLYRDNSFVIPMWKWNDLVTLVVAAPMLFLSMLLSRRGSRRAQLVWMAMLNYMLYNYAFYLFATAFNKVFLLYAFLVALSIFALIFGLLNLEAKEIGDSFRRGRFYRVISAYMIFIALGLSTVYTMQSLKFVFTGELPEILVKVEHPTHVIFGLDFTLLIPVFLLGGIWLWKGKAWGYVLASISMVKGATYTLVLAVVSFFATRSDTQGASSEWPFWTLLTLGSILAAFYLLNKLPAGQRLS
jgi:hypothetical protein